ncbi:hypothetical protein GCM10009819_19270 [Agromyces tropicus]|uniref:Thioredoxin family protein n=1 Tax=Agromyces tropicus TaxID=555371 RepID=A0ABN2UG69_9MICO
MRVEVLHIDDCANWRDAGALARSVLDALGRPDVAVEFVLIETEEQAAATGFAGSPTILVDGTDVAPAAGAGVLACRVYPTDRGSAPLPARWQVEAAVRSSAEAGAGRS